MRLGFRTQISVLVVAVFLVAQAVTFWFFVDERALAVQTAIGNEAAGRAANIVRLIEIVPTELHADIVAGASSPLVNFELGSEASIASAHQDNGNVVENRIRSLLDDGDSRRIRVEIKESKQRPLPIPNLSPELAEMHIDMMKKTMTTIEMELSIETLGSRWLNVSTRFERPPLQWSSGANIAFLTISGTLILSIFWISLLRLTRPMSELAAKADELGRGGRRDPLVPSGPTEVRNMVEAFNAMQERLSRLVTDRTQMLASLAHDLRTPLTALRVWSEMVEDAETKEGISTSLCEVQDMVEATLAYASGVGRDENSQNLDIATFLLVLWKDTFGEIKLKVGPKAMVQVKPGAMRRALRNIIENAQRYGSMATLSWKISQDEVEIRVDDVGPGIPECHIDDVLQPFWRIENSRSLETGGHGLGLAIARGIVLEHGGKIELKNRKNGGLRVRVILPVVSPQAQGSESPKKIV